MGFFDLLFGKGGRGNRTLENDTNNDEGDVKKPSGDPLDALFATGKYAKTEEQKQEEKEKRTLGSRFKNIKLKKYNKTINSRYNDDKKRIEVGDGFELRQLPDIVYSLAKGSITFRKDIGGEFDRRDRDRMQRMIRKRRVTVKRMNKKLFHNARGEKHQVVRLGELVS